LEESDLERQHVQKMLELGRFRPLLIKWGVSSAIIALISMKKHLENTQLSNVHCISGQAAGARLV
jgi:hypothetical protein